MAVWRDAGIDAVVWDRAPAHQTAAVHQQGGTLIAQPPFSPELNPAERVFEEVRRHVAGLVYVTLPEKDAAVSAFLADLEADPARIRRLAGWDWIDEALAALPLPQEIAA